MPAVYFNYHIGGTKVSYETKRYAFSFFLINICAVIGGIYSIAQISYNVLHAIFGTKFNYIELVQWIMVLIAI